MNVRQNLFLTFSKKKIKKLKFFLIYVFCHFARMSPSRRGPVFAVIYHGLYCLYLPRFRIKSPQFRYSVPHVFSPSFFLSLSLPSFSCSRVVVNFEEHRIKLLMFSSFRNAPELVFLAVVWVFSGFLWVLNAFTH